MATPATGRGLVALFKRGWHEIPEVIGSSFMGILGVGIGCYTLYRYYDEDGENRRFKTSFQVLRPDDPRVQKIRYD